MKRYYSELHAHSAFSFLLGASQPEDMIRRAVALEYESIAITDPDGFYGSARAQTAAEEHGIRALVGSTLAMPDGSRLPVLCATRNGYRMLSRHLTSFHLKDGEEPLCKRNGDLIVLTGGREGPVGKHLVRGDKKAALKAAEDLIVMFGKNNIYMEIHRHGLRDDGRINRLAVDLARHLGLSLLASNAPLHAERGDRMLADAFTCLRHHTSLDQAGRLLAPNGERHLKWPHEMRALFADLPEAIENTLRVSDRCEFTLEKLGYEFPAYPGAKSKAMKDQMEMLRRESDSGLEWRYGGRPQKAKARKQLDTELALIEKLEFAGYFLIVQDIVNFAKKSDILCQGRGSAANSVLCFVLGITAVDPIQRRLLFERFLTENMKGWPDIDIDLPSGDQREKVIQHVFEKYGKRNAAMTANVISYRPKSAFREMSKVLGFPPCLADRFSESPGSFHSGRGDQKEPDSQEEAFEIRRQEFEDRLGGIVPPSHPRLAALSRLVLSVLALPRHLGQHSGGMIICDHGLDLSVPLQPARMPGRTVVQWDKTDCDELGLVKIDLLGLGMMAALEDAIRIREKRGHPVDLANLPKNDPAVFDLLCRADTIGTFQVESRAQMATLPIMKPRRFFHLAIEVAIVRPGPIVGNLAHPYLSRKNRQEKITYLHPKCKTTLFRTLGVPLFQEQMLKMSMDLAGFSGSDADALRKAVGYGRDSRKMEKMILRLDKGMEERGIQEETRKEMAESVRSFALYGFPQSHALSFALLAYASCWFKVHHPAEFYTGLLNNQPMGFYSPHTLIQDGKRHGIRFLPVSCLWSGKVTEVIDDVTLRLGLNRLKGLSAGTAERLVGEREARMFDSLEDFLERVRPTVRERRLLAEAGALNELPEVGHRREAMWQVELPLHDDLLTPASANVKGVLPAMTEDERLSADSATQGASTGPHPMRLWRKKHGRRELLRAVDLQNLPSGVPVTVGGMVICRQRPGTAKGHCFISLEDETGIANLFVKRETFHEFQRVITAEPFLLARGRLQRSVGDQPTVYVTHVEGLAGSVRDQASASYDFH